VNTLCCVHYFSKNNSNANKNDGVNDDVVEKNKVASKLFGHSIQYLQQRTLTNRVPDLDQGMKLTMVFILRQLMMCYVTEVPVADRCGHSRKDGGFTCAIL